MRRFMTGTSWCAVLSAVLLAGRLSPAQTTPTINASFVPLACGDSAATAGTETCAPSGPLTLMAALPRARAASARRRGHPCADPCAGGLRRIPEPAGACASAG